MLKEKYAERILNQCPVDYFLSANDGARVEWPFRMQPTHEASPTYSKISKKYAIDSAIMKPELGNEEALEEAIRLDADFLLLADYLPFDFYWKSFNENTPQKRKDFIRSLEDKYSDNYNASLESIKKGIKLTKRSKFKGKIWVPLQKPHIEMYEDLNEPDDVAIGGIKDDSNRKKVEYSKKFRDFVGDDVYIHALGVGVTDEVAKMIRGNPNILDSIDSQTPMATANNMEYMRGKERMTPTSLHSLAYLFEDCRKMTDLVENQNDSGKLSFFDY